MKKFVALALIFTACSADKNPDQVLEEVQDETTSEVKKEISTNYFYEPVTTELTGTITIQKYWGPPGYGEDTTADMKEMCDILTLEKGIDIKEDTTNEFNTAQKNIDIIQLASQIKTDNFIGKKVTIKGQLFGAQTGHHHTPVLLDVKEIKESK